MKQPLEPDLTATHTHSGAEAGQMQPSCRSAVGTASFTTTDRMWNGMSIHRRVPTNVVADAAVCARRRKSQSLSQIRREPSVGDRRSCLDVDIKMNSGCAVSKGRKPNFHF